MFNFKRVVATTLAIGVLAIIGMAALPQQSVDAFRHKENKSPCLKNPKKCELMPVPSGMPTVTIDSPADGQRFSSGSVSPQRSCMAGSCSSWAADVTLTGHATDREDGNLTGSSLTWTVQGGSGRLLLVGSGEKVTVRLFNHAVDPYYAGYVRTNYDITLSAMDSDGNVDTETITVSVSYFSSGGL